jgi:hypothetical protein
VHGDSRGCPGLIAVITEAARSTRGRIARVAENGQRASPIGERDRGRSRAETPAGVPSGAETSAQVGPGGRCNLRRPCRSEGYGSVWRGPGQAQALSGIPRRRSGARGRPSGRRVPTRRDGLADRRAGDRAGIEPQTCEQRVMAEAAPQAALRTGARSHVVRATIVEAGPFPAEGDLPGTTQSRLAGTAGGRSGQTTDGRRSMVVAGVAVDRATIAAGGVTRR